MKDKRRVIRFDLPGFGLTGPSPDGVYSSNNDIGVLIAILDKLRVDHCVLGGASLGGGIAWRAALTHPSRVEKIILVDAGGYPTKPISQPLGFRLASIPGMDWLFENILPRYLVEQGFRDVWGDPNRVTPEMVERSIELTQREGNRRALLDRFHQYRGSGSLAQRIPELKLPTLIIWGGKDRLIPPENARRFHRDIPGSSLVIFEDLGHDLGVIDQIILDDFLDRFHLPFAEAIRLRHCRIPGGMQGKGQARGHKNSGCHFDWFFHCSSEIPITRVSRARGA